ncbi:GSCOCG00011325001-RA-CDS, partial [Cotesia congregata]
MSQRRQSVRHDNSNSAWREVLNGVPQGSVLGPLLFMIYITDLPKILNCQHLLYADDLVIYLSCHLDEINGLVARLNEEIGRIVDWCKLNCLRLNASKTKSIIIGSRIKVSSDVCLSAENIVVAGSVIPYVKTVKYLGVVIDNTLSWEHQVTKMCNQAMSSLAQLKISNEVFNRQLRIKLVTTIIFPIFDYCCAAFTNMSKKLQMRLQK